jgi:hypothetical protein
VRVIIPNSGGDGNKHNKFNKNPDNMATGPFRETYHYPSSSGEKGIKVESASVLLKGLL